MAKKSTPGGPSKAGGGVDASQLLKLVRTQPERAAAALRGALANEASFAAAERAAVGACRQLRKDGHHEEALVLAEAAGRRTRALRLEEALAALGCGRDEQAREIGALDGAIGALLGPVLRALPGGAAGPAGPSSGLPEPIAAAAELVGHAVRGDEAGFEEALRRPELAARVSNAALLLAIEAACRLALGKIDSEASALRAHALLSAVPQAQATFLHELAERSPRLLLTAPELRRKIPARQELRLPILRRAWAAALRDPTLSRDALCALLAAASSQGFDETEQGTASLHEAFGHRDPQKQREALDRAAKHGADPLEVHRRSLLHALTIPSDSRSPAFCEKTAASIDALADELMRTPHGALCAALARLQAAFFWLGAESEDQARRALRGARELAPALRDDAPGFLLEIDLFEIDLLADSDQIQAAARLEALVERDPRSLQPWLRLLGLTPDEQRDDLILRAAKATEDGWFLEKARAVLLRRGMLEPFEELPATPSVGLLASRMDVIAEVFGGKRDLTPEFDQLQGLAAHLPQRGRLALDVAALHSLGSHGKLTPAEGLIERAMMRHVGHPEELCRLFVVLGAVERDEPFVDAFMRLDLDVLADREQTLMTLGHIVTTYDETPKLKDFFAFLTGVLPREKAKQLKVLRDQNRDTIQEDVPPHLDEEAIFEELARLLRPEFALNREHRDDRRDGFGGELAELVHGDSAITAKYWKTHGPILRGTIFERLLPRLNAPREIQALFAVAFSQATSAERTRITAEATRHAAEARDRETLFDGIHELITEVIHKYLPFVARGENR